MRNKLWFWFAGFLAAQFVFMLAIFPSFEFRFGNETLKVLDARLGYGYDDVMALMEQLGAEGRLQYQQMIQWADMLYPLVYGGLLALCICLLGKNLICRWYCFVPLVTVIADYGENLLNLMILNSYPEINVLIVWWSSMANQLKWYSLVIILIALLLLMILRSFQLLKKQLG